MGNQLNFKYSIFRLASATAVLLLIPLTAMQFSNEVNWTLSDFIFAGTLLFGTGVLYLLITKNFSGALYRFAVGFGLFTGLLLIWVNLAVGIIGSENNAINTLYFGVIAIGIMGALYVRFKSQGMIFVMLCMAATQALIVIYALTFGTVFTHDISVLHILSVNSFFIFLFIIAALLFRYDVKEQLVSE